MLVLIAAGCTTVGAVDVTWAPQATASTHLHDNVRGAATGEEAALGFDVGAGVDFEAKSESITSSLIPRFNVRRFPIGENLDADEYFVKFNNEWKRETVTTDLKFDYARDSTLINEATDTGVIGDVKNRDSVTLNPSISWAINDKYSAQTSFLFNSVAYLDATNSGLIDYQYLQGSTGVTYTIDPTTQIFGNFFVSDFRTPDISGKTRTYGGQAGLAKVLTETFDITAALGYVSSDIQFLDQQLALVFDPLPRIVLVTVPNEVTSTGLIANVSLRKKFENINAKFDYTRQVSPSGRGAQSSSDRLELRADQRITQRLTLNFDGSYEMRATEGNRTITALDRDITTLTWSARYRLNEQWGLSFTYRFSHRTSNQTLQTSAVANSNAVFLALDLNGLARPLFDGF